MIDKTLFKFKGFKVTVVFLLITALLQGAVTILQAKYLALTVTNLFNGEKLSLQLLPIVLFSLFFILRQIVVLIREKWMYIFASKAGSDIRQSFSKKLFKLGPNLTETEGTGNIVTLALEGVTQFETYVKLFLPKIFNMLIIPMMILIYTFTLDLRSSIILLLALPTLIFFMVILGYAAKQKADKQYEAYQTLSNHFVDSLRGLETLRLLGLSKRYDRNIQQVSERYRKSTLETLKYAFLSNFGLDFFSSLSVAIVALFLGLPLIEGEMMLLPALTILILAPEYFVPIRDFGTDYHATLDGKNALQALNKMIDISDQESEENVNIEKWNEESEMTVKHLTIQHDEATKQSLDQVHFEWKGYGKIGIIGTSGAGKSTLINVLSGFLTPNDALIEINRNPITQFNNPSWQEQILYIPQHPYIFNDTVANNVAFYSRNTSENDIVKACERAGLSSVISTFPNGLNEKIGESGRVLSGGQEQRIALARAFLDDKRKILLFDEPTAHLDIETEWELKQNMLPLFKEKLVFFATHRLHWMLEMDHIIVLDQGKVVEFGSHEELLQAKGHYFQLIQAQMNEEVQHGQE